VVLGCDSGSGQLGSLKANIGILTAMSFTSSLGLGT
jgi:hypothetical protein